MSRVLLTARARADLIEIASYIAEDNPAAADRLVDRLTAKCRLLAEQPGIGHVHREVAREGLLCSRMGAYLIFYRVIRDGIQVVRYLHGSRNLRRLT